MQFDVDGDGKLTIHEFARAFRALGLEKRCGKKLEMDVEMFNSAQRVPPSSHLSTPRGTRPPSTIPRLLPYRICHVRLTGFDTNGDGFASLEEIEQGLKPKVSCAAPHDSIPQAAT